MWETLTLENGLWRYDKSAPLGTPGGFAAVYAGRSANDAPVAIKIFHADREQDANRELEFASTRLGKKSSHVVTVYDCGIDAVTHQPAIVMARGEHSLSQYGRTQGLLSDAAACAIACEITDGLNEVSDWVHRDLKPANVIWCDGTWRLVDFGIARIANASTAPGTMKHFLSAHYAAPEQWNSERATHATDVYALGCIIHELLTGRTLFDGVTQADLAHQHRSVPARITAGSAALQSLLHRMVAKPQDVRPTFEELRRRLKSFADESPPSNRRASALSAVSAAVSAQQAEREVAAVQAQRATQTREELREHALRVLRGIQTALFDRISEDAPAAVIRNVGNRSGPVMEASLGRGTLTMSVSHMRDVAQGMFSISGWDVICWDFIKCAHPDYDRSASLWYVNDGSGRWQWLEASYFCWAQDSGVNEPCGLPPGRDADIAASKAMGAWNFAHPPRAIENDTQEAFIERWINHFAQAAEGMLRHPSNLPEV